MADDDKNKIELSEYSDLEDLKNDIIADDSKKIYIEAISNQKAYGYIIKSTSDSIFIYDLMTKKIFLFSKFSTVFTLGRKDR